MSAAVIEAALAYAARGWRVCPWQARNGRKFPLTPHWNEDATTDPAVIQEWGGRWPEMLIAVATGKRSGVVALDIDVDKEAKINGWDGLEEIGVPFAPVTAMDHTPRGGTHLLFKHPGFHVATIASRPGYGLGPGLDIRGDGGCLILPPGPGRYWDPHYGFDTPLADMPEWMVVAKPMDAPRHTPRPRAPVALSRYAEAALENAVKRIIEAGAGSQETTLNGEAFSLGQLTGAGEIPPGLALDSLLWAGRRLPSHDARRPWRAADVERKIKSAFADGLREPRTVAHG